MKEKLQFLLAKLNLLDHDINQATEEAFDGGEENDEAILALDNAGDHVRDAAKTLSAAIEKMPDE